MVCIILYGCSSVKKLPTENQLIVKQVFEKNGESFSADPIAQLSLTRVNEKILGVPLKLHIYNLSNPDPEAQFDQWLEKKQKREERLNQWLSPKQVVQLKKYHVDFNNWLKKTGEAPAIVDSTKIALTQNIFEKYYNNMGYFNAEVTTEIDSIGPQRAEIAYRVNTGPQFYLDSISVVAASKAIDSLYKTHKEQSLLVAENPFRVDQVEKERDRLIDVFRNNGIYNFQQRSIRFKVYKDSTGKDTHIPIIVEIKNAQKRIQDSLVEIPYSVQKVDRVSIYVDDPSQRINTYTDSIDQGNIRLFSKGKLTYNPKILTQGVQIQQNTPYSYSDRTATYRYFNELQNFKFPSIVYQPSNTDSQKLDAEIYLSPKEKFSLGFDADVSHSNIQDVGVSLGTSLLTRNVFRGAEILEVGIKGTVGSSRDVAEEKSSFFNLFELGANVGLRVPKMLAPLWMQRLFVDSKQVKTNIVLGASLQENIGLDRQNFTTTVEYSWKTKSNHRLNFKLADIEFVNNKAINNYFNVYRNSYDRLNQIAQQLPEGDSYLNSNGNLGIPTQAEALISTVLNGQSSFDVADKEYVTISSIQERKDRLTANNFIVGSSFTFLKNNQESFVDEDFSQLRIKVEWAGNILNTALRLGKRPTDQNGNYEIFNLAPSQYIKTELNYIKHWEVGTGRIFAFRAFSGIALPYGNAQSIPFSRSYYAGGSNYNRAWQAYNLGPGSSSGINEFNEANFKLAFNLEYRYPIIGPFKGAFFIDAGNIWNVNNNVTERSQIFSEIRDLDQLAIGTGIGIRYDFDFFVFRLDTAFKTYNPTLPKKERWGSQLALKKAVFNIGINYPF